MSAIVFVLAGLLLVAGFVWGIGSGIARFAGILLMIDGVGGIFIHAGNLDNTRYPIEAAIGLGLWLTGHWLYALKHRLWRSRLAMAVWRLPVLSQLAPVATR